MKSVNKVKDMLRGCWVLICERGSSSVFAEIVDSSCLSSPVCTRDSLQLSPSVSLSCAVTVPSAHPTHSDVTRWVIMRTDCFPILVTSLSLRSWSCLNNVLQLHLVYCVQCTCLVLLMQLL